jgi:hypothetical protein
MSLNLLRSIKSPFARPSDSTRKAVVLVNLIAVGLAVVVVAVSDSGDAARSLFRVCYVKPQRAGAGANVLNVIGFYIPVRGAHGLVARLGVLRSSCGCGRLHGNKFRARAFPGC